MRSANKDSAQVHVLLSHKAAAAWVAAAHLLYMDGNVEEMQDTIYAACCDNQTLQQSSTCVDLRMHMC